MDGEWSGAEPACRHYCDTSYSPPVPELPAPFRPAAEFTARLEEGPAAGDRDWPRLRNITVYPWLQQTFHKYFKYYVNLWGLWGILATDRCVAEKSAVPGARRAALSAAKLLVPRNLVQIALCFGSKLPCFGSYKHNICVLCLLVDSRDAAGAQCCTRRT